MDLRLTEGRASIKNTEAISSKSYVHRLLIASSIYGGCRCIATNILSKDMEATVSALGALGASIGIEREGSDHLLKIDAPLGAFTKGKVTADCGESGSTARFLLPPAPFFADSVTLTGSGRLPERPMGPLCDVLRAAGVTVSDDHLPITVSGRMKAGAYEIPGNVSSQFISGLLFALPLSGARSSIKIKGELGSAAYIDMTAEVLRKSGVIISGDHKEYIIEPFSPLNSTESGSGLIRAEGDWSNAAYVMVLASLGSGRFFDDFTVCGLNPESIQGDRAAAEIFRQFGVTVKYMPEDAGGSYTIKGRPVNCVDIDCSQIPDLVPALAVMAAYSNGKSRFRNVERLRMKECDRIGAIEKMFSAVDVQVDITSDGKKEDMTVTGKGAENPVSHVIEADSFNDHRIAMAASALAFIEKMPVVIKDAMSVNKSYPGFFDLVKGMGIAVSEET